MRVQSTVHERERERDIYIYRETEREREGRNNRKGKRVEADIEEDGERNSYSVQSRRQYEA